jgi:hypothetical protein
VKVNELCFFTQPQNETPDNTLIEHVRLAMRIRNALNAAGINIVGEVRKNL